MKVWVTSDLHLGHAKLLAVEPARRRFASVEEIDRFIEAQWRERVSSQDVVYVVGDVAWNREALDKMRNWPGIKKLVLGNHDKFDMAAYLAIFRKVTGYSVIANDWLIAHIPVSWWCLSPRFAGQIHGHTHGKGSPPSPGVYRSACVELHNFAPILLEHLIRGDQCLSPG